MFRRKADARDVGNSRHFPAGGCLHFGDAFVPGCSCVAPVPGCAWSGFGDGDAVFPNRAGDATAVDGSVPLGNRHHGDFLGEVFDGLFDARIRPAPVPGDEALLATRASELMGGERGEARLVASCSINLVANLTRGCRPFALIENVVTHSEHRGRGYGQALLAHAQAFAWGQGCYKVMLMTGRKDEAAEALQMGLCNRVVATGTRHSEKHSATISGSAPPEIRVPMINATPKTPAFISANPAKANKRLTPAYSLT